MDWQRVDDLLKLHIQAKPVLENGIDEIRSLLHNDNKSIVVKIDTSRLKDEFCQFLEKTFNEIPIPNTIKSLYFGLFTMDDNSREVTTLYMGGSARTPVEDGLDWNVEPAYFPKYYFVPTDFKAINETHPGLSGDQELLVFNGITNLLVMHTLKEFESFILKHQNAVYLGAGFDAGDTYLLGQLTKTGLN